MKKVYSDRSEQVTEYPGSHSWEYFGEHDTPCQGYRAMFNYFYNEEYIAPYGVHEDNEGFFVVSGEGTMIIGDAEFVLRPGISMIAPADVPHAIRKTSDENLGVFLFHFPK